jgi:hypothetical protein
VVLNLIRGEREMLAKHNFCCAWAMGAGILNKRGYTRKVEDNKKPTTTRSFLFLGDKSCFKSVEKPF